MTAMESQAPVDGPRPVGLLMNLQIVWGALLMSIAMYVGLSYFVRSQGGPVPDQEQIGAIELAFAVTSLTCLIVSYFLPRKLLRDALGADDPQTLELTKLTAKAFAPWIIRMALSESVAIFGLLIVLISHQPQKILPFAVLATLAMLTAAPSERALRSAAQR